LTLATIATSLDENAVDVLHRIERSRAEKVAPLRHGGECATDARRKHVPSHLFREDHDLHVGVRVDQAFGAAHCNRIRDAAVRGPGVRTLRSGVGCFRVARVGARVADLRLFGVVALGRWLQRHRGLWLGRGPCSGCRLFGFLALEKIDWDAGERRQRLERRLGGREEREKTEERRQRRQGKMQDHRHQEPPAEPPARRVGLSAPSGLGSHGSSLAPARRGREPAPGARRSEMLPDWALAWPLK
jgi:hypothetical protein